MANPSLQKNPLDYPKYVRGLRPALPDSVGDYVETELEKIQNSMENMAVAADANTKTQVADLKITVDANTAAITDEQTVRATEDESLAQRITTLESTPSGNTIYRQASQPAAGGSYADGDMWFDTDDSNKLYIYDAPSATWVLSADQRIDANLALIQQEQTARADADTTLSDQINTVSANVSSNTAAITTEQQARIDGDGTNASAISSLQTTVDGNTSSISTLQSSVNGISAKYGVTLDVNGYVTGWEANNDGSTGSFIIRSDTFAVVDPAAPAGDLGMAPFVVSGGNVYLNGQQLQANSVLPSALDVTSLSAITATIGTLRTATTGQRVEIHDNLIEVFDSTNTLRVRMGVW